MNPPPTYSNHDHPAIIAKAEQLCEGAILPIEKAEKLFHFVRDEIEFGFPSRADQWNEMKASEVLGLGKGYCNTKATLLVALCRAVGIEARVHYGKIDAEIMRGILPWFAFPFLPRLVDHSWTEVRLNGEWKAMDSYINDLAFFYGCRQHRERSGKAIGYSLSYLDGKCSESFNFGEVGFVHMGAVRLDLGTYEDAGEFFATDAYAPLTKFQRWTYPLMVGPANRKIERIRQDGATWMSVQRIPSTYLGKDIVL